MSLLGFDAVGRFALGQIRQDYTLASVTLPAAVGVGTVGVTPNPAALLIGVSGTGTVGSLAKTVADTLVGVSGIGVAGFITPLVATTINGVSGTGVARSLAILELGALAPAVGIGVVGIVATSSTALTIQSAVGIGVAGSLQFPTVGGQPQQAAGIGRAGNITVVISGGGGGEAALPVEQPQRRDNRIKTGLLPLDRRPTAPKPEPRKPLLPPTFDAPPLAPEGQPPIPEVVPAEVNRFDDIARQIMEAETAHAAGLKQSEQDEQDIADVLAALAMLD